MSALRWPPGWKNRDLDWVTALSFTKTRKIARVTSANSAKISGSVSTCLAIATLSSKSFQKLLQEKLKKGYVEIEPTSEVVQEDVKQSTVGLLKNVAQVSEQPETKPISPNVEERAIAPKKLEIVRSLNLSPEDWLWATRRTRSPLPKPQAKPFDLKDALKRLMKIQEKSPDRQRQQLGYFGLDWSKAEMSISSTPEEAHFWFTAMTCVIPGSNRDNTYFITQTLEDLAAYLSSKTFTGELKLSDKLHTIIQNARFKEIILPLYGLFPLMELIIAIQNLMQDVQHRYNAFQYSKIKRHLEILTIGFRDYIWPYLSDVEIHSMQQQLNSALNLENPKFYRFASYLGMHGEVYNQIKRWESCPGSSPGYVNLPNKKYLRKDEAIEILLGQEDPHVVKIFARSLKITLTEPIHIRGWLAQTKYNALDWICYSIIHEYPKVQETSLKSFSQAIQAPEAAPYMLELWLSVKKSQVARQWLEDYPTEAIVGLIPVAAGILQTPVQAKPGEVIKAAIAFLSSMKRKGYESVIHLALEAQPPEVVEKIQSLILDQEDIDLPFFDAKTTLQWLKDGLAELSRQRTKPISWVNPADLPPIVVDNHCLTEDQVNACLTSLTLSTLESPLLLVHYLKTYANSQSLDTFIWSLFERWLTEGGSSKEKWAMMALGLLGSDAIALKLAPLIRNWPGENQHPRAVLGLECLRAIGTDTALMQINGIAQKTKYQGLQARAEECMKAIARDRQLTQDQLEDRIIPDCGLDATGRRTFNFGPRQFHFALSADLKPIVKDEKGKHLTTLPKPNSKDDTEKAQQAIADWKLVKKQVVEVVKIQSVRLEDAMITERRWPWHEFSTLLAKHPLATHLVQRLIWGSFSADGSLLRTFRVSEDHTFSDAMDDVIAPDESAMVGIVHPIHLSEDLKAQWGEVFSDYEIIPPFPQIHREVYYLTSEEIDAEEIKRFQNIQIPGEMLAYTMEKFGWQRGALHDHGDYRVHYKDFDQGKVTAVVGDYECQHVEKSSIWGSDAIDGCLFLVGQHREPYEYPTPGSWAEKHTEGKRIPLREVHPLVMSEVLRDLTAIATAAQAQ